MVKVLHPLGSLAARINLPPKVRVPVERDFALCAGRTTPVAVGDPAAAAQRALESPLEYPPLADGVVPDDKLAIVVDESVPMAASVVRGVVAAAQAAGVETAAITVVAIDEDFGKTLRAEFGEEVRVVIHDPEDPLNLALLGLNEKNERLLVNRSVFEADVVVPIGCARLPAVAGSGVFDCLYPRLSDAETIGRLRTPSQLGSAARLAAARRKSDEAGWLLGVALVMQVVPASDGGVAEIVAGDPRAVARALPVALRATLVVPRASTGEPGGCGRRRRPARANLGKHRPGAGGRRAAGRGRRRGGDLLRPGRCPRPRAGQLIGSADFDGVERNVRNDHSPDSWPAWQLARALQRGPVYFLSRLEADDVEDLGLAPIADVDELARLAQRQESCIVLDDSQYVVATVAGEA